MVNKAFWEAADEEAVSSIAAGDGRFFSRRRVYAREDEFLPHVQCPQSVLFGMVTVGLRVSY